MNEMAETVDGVSTHETLDHDELTSRLDAIAVAQAEMQATLSRILERFDSMVGEVKPLIDQISEHPFARMLGLKK